ncbi:MAG TPA: hypothetical protein HA366_02980 [Candidatus Methanomethylophilaceae archaeon]|nr:hypothetical protein [Candidatus Methanomethylophilaceae archaeon]
MAACLSGLFRAPLGCTIYALEVPYRNDMESDAAVPSTHIQRRCFALSPLT